jgi:hypothetical protein
VYEEPPNREAFLLPVRREREDRNVLSASLLGIAVIVGLLLLGLLVIQELLVVGG